MFKALFPPSCSTHNMYFNSIYNPNNLLQKKSELFQSKDYTCYAFWCYKMM